MNNREHRADDRQPPDEPIVHALGFASDDKEKQYHQQAEGFDIDFSYRLLQSGTHASTMVGARLRLPNGRIRIGQ